MHITKRVLQTSPSKTVTYFLSTDDHKISKRDLKIFSSSEVSLRLSLECSELAPGSPPTHRRPALRATPLPRLASHPVAQARTSQYSRPAYPASIQPVQYLRVRRDCADTKSSLRVAPRRESRRSATRAA